ncbi:hypothetical protein D910_09032 [Dendroctonus ponderosae]|uniref:Uncharacterized protein n=1 Tax=Dendroctonus ponderosae TaxID=77166 RepID=U4UNV3_DENPD|nr:hypothetical protein D910_09032 [Dendroctonus ponderosae]
MKMMQSCDTFVVLPPLTKRGVVFGKNSDRPQGEVQEVVYFPATEAAGPETEGMIMRIILDIFR